MNLPPNRPPMLPFIAACIGLALLVRIPLALWGGVALDGDEAIVGLMARHIASGQALPLFFYGQSYGLSLPEAGAAALSFSLFGSSPLSLHMAILGLWTVGALFFCLAARRSLPPAGAWLFGLGLALLPAWFEWSFKARGFYAGGFMVSGLCTWLLTLAHGRQKPALLLAGSGMLLGLLGQMHPLWLLTLAPCVAAWLFQRRDAKGLAIMAGGFAAIYGGIYLLFVLGGYDYWAPGLFSLAAVPHSLLQLPSRVLGLFGEGQAISRAVWSGLFAAGLLAGALGALLWRSLSLAALCLACLLPFLATLPVGEEVFRSRYVLSAGVPLLALLALLLAKLLRRRPAAGRAACGVVLLALLVAAGADLAGLYKRVAPMRNPAHDREVRQLASSLLERGIRHVYSLDGQLQWQLMFFSNEQITARWLDPQDRVPRYPLRVDAALLYGRPVAVVGPRSHVERMQGYLEHVGAPAELLHGVKASYFWLAKPTPPMLMDMQFRLNPTQALQQIRLPAPQ